MMVALVMFIVFHRQKQKMEQQVGPEGRGPVGLRRPPP